MAESSTQGLRVIACPLEAKPDDITVDIVAVPGLAADPQRSFGSESGKGFNWLSDSADGIPSDIPSARILLYEYDSRYRGSKALPQTLYNVAVLLLDSLVAQRQGHETRPLVFLAHSMGGLVVAKALTIAVSRPEEIERMRIYECFAGGIFFGTPFRGSSEAARAFLLAEYFEFGEKIPKQMLQCLDPERDSLTELRDDFVRLVTKEPRASIACIHELKKQDYMKEKIGQWFPSKVGPAAIVVTKESASLDCADEKRGLECNHRNLNRFDSVKDGRYEVVRLLLKGIVNKARLIVKRRLAASKHSTVDDAVFAKLSDSLNIVDFRRKRRNIESVSGNSSWILEDPKYRQWSSQTEEPYGSRSLWVSGSEGQGKSKAALAVVEALEEEENKNKNIGARNSLVAYFFCDSTPDSRSAENLLKSLMWQLILKRRNLAQYVKGFAAQDKSRSMSSNDTFSLSKLVKGLEEMLRDPSVDDVQFVVNNLHYLSADEPSTQEFLNILKSKVLISSDGLEDPIRDKVRWLFLSRPWKNIRDAVQSGRGGDALRIDLEDGSNNSQLRQAHKLFTRDRVKALAINKQYSLALQYFVTSILQNRTENNTLWVEVVCRLLEGLPSNHVQVRKVLEALPQDLNGLISRTWAEALNVKTEEINTTKEILRTLAIAYEDPTIDELKVLAELDDDADASHVREHIRACGPLLRVYDSSEFGENDLGSFRVTFIHPLAKDALLGEKSSRALIGLSEDDDEHTEVKWQHGIVALRCFSYTLGQLQTEQDTTTWERETPSDDKELQAEKELDDLFPETTDPQGDEEPDLFALEYPLKYWLRHGNEATPDFVETLDLKHAFWAIDSSARRRWWKSTHDDDYGELKGLTSLHVAAFFGLVPLINSLLNDGHKGEIHVRDSWHNQPLHWAASQGHLETMERLLLEGADINDGRQDHVWTPLHMAASSGKIDAMKLLLTGHYGPTDVNAVAKEDGTPLTLALAWNHLQAAELLLSSGASPTLTADDADSPVAAAALRGFENIVIYLLQVGGVENLVSQEYGTALAAAASSGHLSIVQRLLQVDADQNSRQRALLEASKNDFPPIVALILRSTAHLSCDEAFQSAAVLGHDLVLQELWSYHMAYRTLSQATINTALYLATDNEQESAVKFLLYQCQGQPDAGGMDQGNAITAAAYDANIAIIQMLIHANANINCTSGYPLQAAASEGHGDVVALLLDCGAYVNGCSDLFSDGTALQAACVAGHYEVAKMLLSRGADPNLGAGTFTNPVTAAASQGHGLLLELLLQSRANPNVYGGADGSTPLINAAMTLRAQYLETMIRYGANVNTCDPDEDTALIISALFGDQECVELLIRYGANINFCGKKNGTALQAAASGGYSAICSLLLKHGANPTIRGGPYSTILQAAASSGDKNCVKLVLENDSYLGRDRIDINAQGGLKFTTLHAAAAKPDDGCLRLVLARQPQLNIVSPVGPLSGTALQSAILAGCNRNARLLLEAGADPNISAGKHDSALQAAALKCSVECCDLLLERGAKIDGWSGKYGSPLVAAVVRGYHSWDDDFEVLELLLEKDFNPQAYRAALETAFKLGCKDAFKLIWKSAQTKGPKKLPLSLKQLLTYFKSHVRRRSATDIEKEDANSDFGDDAENHYQDFQDEEVEVEEEEEEEEEEITQTRGQMNGNTNGNLAGSREVKGNFSGNNEALPIRSGNRSLADGEPQNQRGIQSSSFGSRSIANEGPQSQFGIQSSNSGNRSFANGEPQNQRGIQNSNSGRTGVIAGATAGAGVGVATGATAVALQGNNWGNDEEDYVSNTNARNFEHNQGQLAQSHPKEEARGIDAEEPYTGQQYAEEPYAGQQYTRDQYTGNQYAGNQYAGNQYAGQQYVGEQYAEEGEAPEEEAQEEEAAEEEEPEEATEEEAPEEDAQEEYVAEDDAEEAYTGEAYAGEEYAGQGYTGEGYAGGGYSNRW